MPCGNSLMLHFDSLKLPRQELLDHLIKLESQIGDLSEAKFPGRKFRLPITFKTKQEEQSMQRYMETQRPYASYLPDPMEFVAKNNGFTEQQARHPPFFLAPWRTWRRRKSILTETLASRNLRQIISHGRRHRFFHRPPHSAADRPSTTNTMSKDESLESTHARR